MTRVIGVTCMKNERRRYLPEFLRWNVDLFDDFFIFDDGSNDGGPELAREMGATVAIRDASMPTFQDNEGLFRQAAWFRMEELISPAEGDWIACLDADEFLMGDITSLLTLEEDAVRVQIHECFEQDPSGLLHVRTDGFWGSIWSPRIGRFIESDGYKPAKLGGGSLPQRMTAKAIHPPSEILSILHVGYLKEEDRLAKYNRYKSLSRAKGNLHSASHIESIKHRPSLKVWTGESPL